MFNKYSKLFALLIIFSVFFVKDAYSMLLSEETEAELLRKKKTKAEADRSNQEILYAAVKKNIALAPEVGVSCFRESNKESHDAIVEILNDW